MTKETFESILHELDVNDNKYLLINTNIAVGKGINGVDYQSYLIGSYRAKKEYNSYATVSRTVELYDTYVEIFSIIENGEYENIIQGNTYIPYENIVSVVSCDSRKMYLLNKNY